MTIQQKALKINEYITPLDGVHFSFASHTIFTGNDEKKLIMSKSLDQLMYIVNNFLYQNDLPLVANHAKFKIEKLKQLTRDNDQLILLDNGIIDVVGTDISISVNLFIGLRESIDDINCSLRSINRTRKMSIKLLSYGRRKQRAA